MPFPLLPTVLTIGMPSTAERASTSILIPLAAASSLILSAPTTGIPSSWNWRQRKRLRSRLVESRTSTMRSGFSSRMKSRATTSSMEYAVRL